MATSPPKNTEYLYKYRGMSNLRWLIDILLRQRIYGASCVELNDPMEGRVIFDKSISSDVKQNLLEERSRIAICSLSKSYKNTLMWSHYAEDHKGICLKLAVTSEKWERVNVKYDTTIPSITNNSSYLDLIKSKSKHWEYEQEVRYIRKFKDKKSMLRSRFLSIYIDSIYLGYRMPNKDVAFYKKFFLKLLPKLEESHIIKMKASDIETGFDNI